MGWKWTASLRGVVVLSVMLGVGCTSTPRTSPAERLEFYRAHAGEPVSSIRHQGHLWGWRSLGDSALAVWTRSDRGFLLDLASRCPEMPFATSIGVTNRGGRVSAGFDSVVIPRRAGHGGPVTCRIRTIRPLDTRAVTETREDLQEVDYVERDPSIPDEPDTPPGND